MDGRSETARDARNPSNHTDAPIVSLRATSARWRAMRATSSPATIAGLFDFRISDAIASTPVGSGCAARHSLSGSDASTAVSCSSTSIGSATNTGPFGASVATLKARRMIGAISSARSICTLHLVTGAAIATRSWPSTGLCEPHPRVLLAGGDHDRRIGLERAVDRRRSRCRGPGATWTLATVARPGGLRIKTRGADRDALMQRHDIFDLRKGRQAVEQRRLRGAGIAEDVAHAVGHERFHQHTASAHLFFPVPS